MKKRQPEPSESRSTSKSGSGRKPDRLREQAERRLSKKSSPIPPQDAEKLLHELGVHQIELEMQNEALRQAQDTITVSRERYADLYDFAPVGYFTFDSKGLIAEVNLTGATLLGIERGQLSKKSFSLFVAASSRDAFHRHYRGVLKTGATDTCELQLTRKDGASLYASVRSVPVWDAEGNPTGVRSAIDDITERKQAEERVEERTAELRQAYDQLKKETGERERMEEQLRQAQKMEAVGTLAGGIAHDFNNILAAIIGFTELTIDDAPEGSLIKRNMKNVLKAGVRGRDLVKQILALSRKSVSKRAPLHLTPIITETLKLLRAATPTTVAIEFQTHATFDGVVADPTEISQLLMNLGANAAHAMRERGGLFEIALNDIEFSPDGLLPHPDLAPGAYLELSVKDTGCGMDAATINRIFEPFFTTKERGQGTGLGLAAVHGIAQSLGGAITVASEPDKGSAFTVFLPKIAHAEKARPEMAGEIVGGKETVLFVDDEELLVEMATETLRRLGYEVVATTDAGDALRIFSGEPDRFHCVITDYTMPKATGVELAKDLMRMRPDIPIILCTGYSEMISRDEARALGIREFVMKPLVKRELAETIRRVLDTKTQD